MSALPPRPGEHPPSERREEIGLPSDEAGKQGGAIDRPTPAPRPDEDVPHRPQT